MLFGKMCYDILAMLFGNLSSELIHLGIQSCLLPMNSIEKSEGKSLIASSSIEKHDITDSLCTKSVDLILNTN